MQELVVKCDHCGKKLDLSNQSHDYDGAEIDMGYNWLQCDLCSDCMKELYQYVLKYVGQSKES